MATKTAYKRLTREYKNIQESPPPFITAHPTDSNILEWVYIITGPPETPYENGQYWGTLTFPADYPFKPPAIRMMTPSGRFSTSTRLCLSISDFHPKSFNPAWEVSTILIGLLSFMTSEEMTTGSVAADERQRKALAFNSRWWNSTGGGMSTGGGGKIGQGDGGARFRNDWPEIDRENWAWMTEKRIDAATGRIRREAKEGEKAQSLAEAKSSTAETVAETAALVAARNMQIARNGQSWLSRHKVLIVGVVVVAYVAIGRMFSNENL